MILIICSIIVFLALLALIAFVFRSNLFGKHPLSGIRVKICQQSDHNNTVVATGLTDRNGNVEFKDLPTGSAYSVQFDSIKKGLHTQNLSLTIEDVNLKDKQSQPVNQQKHSPSKFVIKKSARTEATVTYHDDWIKANILG